MRPLCCLCFLLIKALLGGAALLAGASVSAMLARLRPCTLFAIRAAAKKKP
jgi:hypothetical protein